MILPMLAHKFTEKHFARHIGYTCLAQPKFNGVRAIWDGERFTSRTGEEFHVLGHIKPPRGVPLDGELYRHGWPLQRILSACTPVRLEPTADTAEITYVVFDTPDITKGFQTRFRNIEAAAALGEACPGCEFARTATIGDDDEREGFYHMCIAHGYEGTIYRATRGVYNTNGRSYEVLKRKAWRDGEFLCCGVVKGTAEGAIVGRTISRGLLSDTLGSLKCHSRGGIFEVFSGLPIELRDAIWANNALAVGKKIKVRYTGYSSAGKPLNPVFCCIMP